jgi:hypothetical protein
MILWHFLVHWTGSDYGFPYGHFQPYDFLSGFASLSIIGLLIAQCRKHNCHVHRCWRIGRHLVEGTPYTVCRRHDPSGPVSAADVRQRYHLYLGGKPGRG